MVPWDGVSIGSLMNGKGKSYYLEEVCIFIVRLQLVLY